MKCILTAKNPLHTATRTNDTRKRKVLAAAVAVSLLQMSSTALAGYVYDNAGNPIGDPIGDLEIYKASKSSGANVMMMLDASASMGVNVYQTADNKNKTWILQTQDGMYFPAQYIQTDSIKADFGYSCVSTGRNFAPSGTNYTGITDRLARYDRLPSHRAGAYKDKNGVPVSWLYGEANSGYTEFAKSVQIEDANGNMQTINYTLSGCTPGKWKKQTVKYKESTGSSIAWEDTGASVWEEDTSVTPTDKHLSRMARMKSALINALTSKDSNGDYVISEDTIIGIGIYGGAGFPDRGKIVLAAKPLTTSHRINLLKEVAKLKASGQTPIGRAYGEAGAYMLGSTTNPGTYNKESGFNLSTVGDIRDANSYKKPGTESEFQCYGKGIYFLTDGYPSSHSGSGNTRAMVDGVIPAKPLTDYNKLNPISYTNSKAGSKSGWKIIAEFSQSLRDYNNPRDDIKTATVGFGSAFDSLSDITKYRTINYKGQQIQVPDCNDGSNTDVKNVCKWGIQENHTPYANNPDKFYVAAQDKKWGGGGFTYAQKTEDITNSLLAFIRNTPNKIDTKPSGTILVPEDPFKGSSVTPYAYVPIIEPNVGGVNEVWAGNIKRYGTKNGTLFGHNDERLYTSLTSSSDGGELIDSTADLWTDTTSLQANGNSNAKVGGFYAQLLAPNHSNVASTRNVFVESYTGKMMVPKTPTGLRKVSVNASGKPVNFDLISDKVYSGGSSALVTDIAERKRSHRMILNFMGYNVPYDQNSKAWGSPFYSITTDNTTITNYAPATPADETRVLGSIIHSEPALAAYSADVDSDGRIKTTANSRDEYLLFGSTDGTLHLVDAESGEEKWALILQEMFHKQSTALVSGSVGTLKFGIDAPWHVSAKYNYSATTGTSGTSGKVELFVPTNQSGNPDTALLDSENYVAMAGYGGFRLGSRGLYAIDLTDKNKPSVLFKITADLTTSDDEPKLQTNSSGTLNVTNNTEYDNVGYIWSKPTMARVNNPVTNNQKPLDVIVFGGGYDLGYEKEGFEPGARTSGNETLGSSIYIADAKTGKKLWSWQNTENHSIVGGVTALDRDDDGYFDHLYFADLGGNLFRADFINSADDDFEAVNNGNNGSSISRHNSNMNVTRILNSSAGLQQPQGTTGLAYRFYNRPVVSFYTDERDNIFALINVASGDRSSPLSNRRDNISHSNRVYGIIDRDITMTSLLTKKANGRYPSPSFKGVTEGDLVKLGGAELSSSTVTGAAAPSINRVAGLCEPEKNAAGTSYILDTSGNKKYSNACKNKVKLISDMLNLRTTNPTINTTRTEKDGWYYTLTRFNGFEQVKNIKAVGEKAVIASKLYLSAYDSSTLKQKAGTCSAEIKGATEVQLYCLPYGICMDDTSISGTGGFTPTGAGIQELTLGAYDEDNTNVKVLITTASTSEQVAEATGYSSQDLKNVPQDPDTATPTVSKNYIDAKPLHGDGSLPDIRESERYILEPKQWYEIIE